MQQKKTKYVTNKELLKEIHKSKISYGYYVEPKYTRFDAIVNSIEEITPELIEAAQLKRNKSKDPEIKELPTDEYIIRVMTQEHVPLDPDRKRKPKGVDIAHAKCNFPSFKHYLTKDGLDTPIEVGRSHWKGGFDNGHFCLDHGHMSNRLAEMFMLLVERYARRGNWRGYTYNDEMQSHALLQLAQIGLQFDESKSDNPFAFYTTTIRNSFTRVLNIEKKNQNIRDEMLIMSGSLPSYNKQLDHEAKMKEASEKKEEVKKSS